MKHVVIRCRAILALFTLGLGVPGVASAAAPDLTQTNLALIDTSRNYNLGPTGMRGWIYTSTTSNGENVQGRTTSFQPWQILVTTVGTNTPASGILASNDVILGVSTGAGNLPVPLFTNDSRKSLGWAIGAAEAVDGKLNLKRWRAGVTNDVTIQLRLTNLAYSATAPFDCPKSAVILSNASAIIGSRSFNGASSNPMNTAGVPGDPVLGLALLATGDTNLLAKARTYAYSITPATLALRFAPGQDTSGGSVNGSGSMWVWSYAYKLVFLAEYYLKTGDTNVLHGINEYAVALAQAQSRYGTMSHAGANLNPDGSFHGTVGGYGPVNSGGLVANLGIVLAKKCLVAAGRPIDPEIDPAIGRAANFFGWYVQKGSIPYGEHSPGIGHCSNGKDAMAALLFAMMGDQPVATEYWTRMSVAGYNGQQYGHTGQGFSYLWSGMSVNVGGTNAVAAYMAQTQWYLDLERRADGSFAYDGVDQFGGSVVSDYWLVGGNNAYAGIDPTACWLLTYALPKQQLYLTGRNANPTNWLSSDKLTNAMWAGVYDQVVGGITDTNQLMSALGEYDPCVRFWAATQLGKLSAAAPLLPALTNLVATSTNPWVRSAACTALGAMTNASALPALAGALKDSDNWVRGSAAQALKNYSPAAASVQVTNMLVAFTTNATDPNVIDWSDPVQIANGFLARKLFGNAIPDGDVWNDVAAYTINANTNLLYPAVRAGLKQPDGAPRWCAANFAYNRFSLADVKALSPDLMTCAATMSQADTMFAGYPRGSAIQTLGKFYVAEAVPLALSMLNVPPGGGRGSLDWNSYNWQVPAMSVLATYGNTARWTLPWLNDYLKDGWDYGIDGSGYSIPSATFAAVQSAIGSITAATSSPSGITNVFPVALSQIVNTTNAKAINLSGFSWRGAVTFTNVTSPAHGTLSGTAPNLTYTPSAGYTGLDSFTFQVRDSFTNSDPATVSLIVGMPAGTGLLGSYYTNVNFTGLNFTRTDPQINFDWGVRGIGVQFIGSSHLGATVGAAPDGSGPPGATMNNWNSFNGSVFANQSVSDNTGAATSAKFSVTSPGTWNSGSTTLLLNGYLYWNGNSTLTTTISGIPYGSYKLYVFSGNDGAGNRHTRITVGGTTYYNNTEAASTTYDLVTSTNSSTFQNGNYEIFSGLTESSQTISLFNYGGNGAFNGFEIVDEASLAGLSASFSVRWRGLLLAPESGYYTFSSLNSDGVRLYVNGILMIDDWGDQSPNWTDGSRVYLNAGRMYPVQMEYYSHTSAGAAKLKWTGPSFAGTNGVLIGKEWLFDGTVVTNPPVFAYSQNLGMLQNTNLAITLSATPNVTNYQIVAPPLHGNLTGTPPLVTYTPANNYNGPDSFTFSASDGVSNSAPATVSISVLAGAPVSFYWTNAASGVWSTAGNWTNSAGGSVAPAAAGQTYYTLNFNKSGTYTLTNDLNSGFVFNQLNFAATVTLMSNTLSPAGYGSVLPQINQNSANYVGISTPLNLTTSTILGGTGGGAMTLSSLISGPGGLVVNNAHGLRISGVSPNTYSGGTVINSGELIWGDIVNGSSPSCDQALGTGPVTLNRATLHFERASPTNALNLNGGTFWSGNGWGVTWKGPVTVNVDTTLRAGYGITISGNIIGAGGFTKTGLDTATFSGTNTYTGANVVQAGTLSCSKAVSLGTGPLSIGPGAIVNLNYTGTRTISGLILSGTNMPPGTYGSSTSAAANKDSHFTGSGTVTIAPPAAPTAGFTASPTSGYAPLRVVFTDTSAGTITNRQWTFGNGNVFSTAAQTTVTNLYANPGVYPVTLVVSGAGGAATNLQSGYINVAVVPAPVLSGGGALNLDPASGLLSAAFAGTNGVRYRMVFSPDLSPSNTIWTAITPPLPDGWTNGSNALITIGDSNSAVATKRFYRIEAKSVSAP